MLKENKGKLLLSSILILLPILIGNYAMPILTLILHWFCLFFTFSDLKNKNQTKKVQYMIFWICPCISLFANGLSYVLTTHSTINTSQITPAFFGVLFIWIGNYLPKCKQNNTIGIKILWTLKNEENWNYTHRISGKTWVCSGFLMLCSLFLPDNIKMIVFILSLLLAVVIPVVCSYLYYRKQKAEGTFFKNTDETSVMMASTTTNTISMIVAIIILVAVGSLLSTGDITFRYKENTFVVDATYWNDLEISYDSIESVAYMENVDAGSREWGFGSPRLLMGAFRNKEFGNYTRYSYTDCDSCVVIMVDGKTIAISGKTDEDTLEIYKKLIEYKNIK